MSTGSAHLTVRDVEVDVVYKDIKHLHIGVYPPLGRVRVAAPARLDDDQVRRAVIQRLPWIRTQRAQFQDAARQSEREMVGGESHYLWGGRLRLRVVEQPGRVGFEAGKSWLIMCVPPGTTADQRRSLLDRWYRQQLRDALPPVIAKWEERLDVSVPQWSLKRMKTKWATCNPETRHLWFNTELAKKHPDYLEYMVVHEMAHYFEPDHGEGFVSLMDRLLPNWRTRRDLLNTAPLAAEDWS